MGEGESKKGLLRRAVDAGKDGLERQSAAAAVNAEVLRQAQPDEVIQPAPASRAPSPPRPPRFEYKVDQVRESLIGDKIKTDALEQLLAKRAGAGWQLKTVTSASVGGRVGPGGVTGLIVVFERPV